MAHSTRPAGFGLLPLLAMAVVMVVLLAACDDTPTPTPTVHPDDIHTVAEIADVYLTNPARSEVEFERGNTYISDVVREFHENGREVFIGSDRSTGDYMTLRVHASVDAVAQMTIGNRLFLRCDDLRIEEHREYLVLTTKELVCSAGQILDYNHRG